MPKRGGKYLYLADDESVARWLRNVVRGNPLNEVATHPLKHRKQQYDIIKLDSQVTGIKYHKMKNNKPSLSTIPSQ